VLGRPSEDLVHALKYEGWSELADLMGDAIADLVSGAASFGAGRRVVAPVPTTVERVRSRGYNQAALLARRVAQVCRLPLVAPLQRVRAGRSQTRLSPRERAENVRGVFRPVAGDDGDLSGADVLLVDDVLTTGATASEAATALSEMGASTVTLVTYARALATAPGEAR
jgi:ComF family protein